jgi:hypothetical protein
MQNIRKKSFIDPFDTNSLPPVLVNTVTGMIAPMNNKQHHKIEQVRK